MRLILCGLVFGGSTVGGAKALDAGDAAAGQTYFAQNCALCHSVEGGVNLQGPSLAGVTGRKAASLTNFNYTAALKNSGLTWDAPSLDKFLANPGATVPGTTMPISVSNAADRQNVIAYLATLKDAAGVPAGSGPAQSSSPTAEAVSGASSGSSSDWRNQAPGVQHHITVADLPAPFATRSAGNGPRVVKRPEEIIPTAPAGFTVKLFASKLWNPRLLRVAPNGDIFIAETGPSRLHLLRAADGADTPSINQVFAEGLDHPFGIAFYPAKNPKWIYVANNNSVVRIPYRSGDLHAEGKYEIIVPKLTDSHGGHSTRDIAFSPDGKRLFISVGSGSNLADGMSRKSPEEIQQWETEHGRGASWDGETNRADILYTDPEGKTGLHTFATGIRNGVGIAVNPQTGDLWTSVNERDGLGDDLVPDYITRVREGGYYGWPWYYLGGNEDPRKAGQRPDLAGVGIVPDVLLQAHSASLQMCFYTAKAGAAAAFPAGYAGDAFAAEHGSWNRTTRTGYKVIRVRLKNGIPTGEYDDFLTGFVVDDSSVWGRPVGVAEAHDGALLVTEDGNGTVWRIAPDNR